MQIKCIIKIPLIIIIIIIILIITVNKKIIILQNRLHPFTSPLNHPRCQLKGLIDSVCGAVRMTDGPSSLFPLTRTEVQR